MAEVEELLYATRNALSRAYGMLDSHFLKPLVSIADSTQVQQGIKSWRFTSTVIRYPGNVNEASFLFSYLSTCSPNVSQTIIYSPSAPLASGPLKWVNTCFGAMPS